MRLVCPNCGAQYEVGDGVIPSSGREVQCSNCGHTWFEQPGAPEAAENSNAPDQVPPQQEAAPKAAPAPERQPQPAPPRKREIDPEVADILRQEAAFEAAARRNEPDPIETQPDLGLSQNPEPPKSAPTADETRDRESRRSVEDVTPAADVAPEAAASRDAEPPRRDLLPDIEEINSTLRHDGAGRVAEPDFEAPRKSSGFARGFILMVIIALLALAAYVFAPQISAAVPEVEPYMTSYMDWVDGLRLWLDAQIRSLTETISTALEG